MKNLILLFLVFCHVLAPLTTNAQFCKKHKKQKTATGATNPITLAPNISKGQEIHCSIVQEIYHVESGGMDMNAESPEPSPFDYYYEVTGATPEAVVLAMKKTEINDSRSIMEDPAYWLAPGNLSALPDFRVSIDKKSGQYLLSEAELLASYSQHKSLMPPFALSPLFQMLAKDNKLDSLTYIKIEKEAQQQALHFTNKAVLRQMASDQLSFLFFFTGRPLAPGKNVTDTVVWKVPDQGICLKAQRTYSLVQSDAYQAEVIIQYKVDPASMTSDTSSLLMIPAKVLEVIIPIYANRPAPEYNFEESVNSLKESLEGLDLSLQQTYTLDIKTGLPVSIKSEVNSSFTLDGETTKSKLLSTVEVKLK